jgi:hypothetical protein
MRKPCLSYELPDFTLLDLASLSFQTCLQENCEDLLSVITRWGGFRVENSEWEC